MSMKATAATSDVATDRSTPSSRPHILFLDGIRGLAALYVCLCHTYNWVFYWAGAHDQTSIWLKIFRPLTFGVYAVDMFIVLSGFCLMLPLVTRSTIYAPFQFWAYLSRRARRIYPPYSAAIVLTLLLIALGNALAPSAHNPEARYPEWGNLLSHLFLIHNLFPDWARSFNDPMWSVATEWQIYFLFPLLLLTVRRVGGRSASVIVGLLFGWGVLFASQQKLFPAAPWQLGLFAMGMTGAELAFSKDEKVVTLRQRIPWLLIFTLGVPLLAMAGALFSQGFSKQQYLVDPIFGLLSTALLVGLAASTQQEPRFFPRSLIRLFESKIALWLGRSSYSLYLIHYPLIVILEEAICLRWNMNLHGRMLVALAGVPLILLLTYAFHMAFERPFLASRKQQTT